MNLWHDIRFSIRMLVKSPIFTLVTMIALGLGIGSNTFMFTVYNAAIFKALPFEKAREMVDITYRDTRGWDGMWMPYSEFEEHRKNVRSLTGIAAHLRRTSTVHPVHPASKLT